MRKSLEQTKGKLTLGSPLLLSFLRLGCYIEKIFTGAWLVMLCVVSSVTRIEFRETAAVEFEVGKDAIHMG